MDFAVTERMDVNGSLDAPTLSRGSAGIGLKLSKGLRYSLYAISGGVWLTGAIWLVAHFFMQKEGEFGFEKHPMEVMSLEVHGAFSFGALWVFGTLGWTHILRGWRANWRRWSGGALVAICAVLIVTGWGLYYFVERAWREWASLIHWVIGLTALAFFFVHWLSRSPAQRPS